VTGSPQITRAFILRSVDYRDSDRILTLLSRDLGKVSAIAKGARSSRRRFGGALEPFAMLEVSVTPGRGREGLYVIDEASVLADNRALGGDLERLGAAAFLTELVRELLPESQPDERMFDLLAECLSLLASRGTPVCQLTICAQLRALALAGFAVSTDACNACGKRLPGGRRAFFDPRRGGVICTGCGAGPILLESAAADAMALLGRVAPPEAGRIELRADVLDEIERALEIFLEEHLGRRLKSNAFRGQIHSR
jgi:DNA repair protein RecO (recombination protein O)